jgi:hypothetical protein
MRALLSLALLLAADGSNQELSETTRMGTRRIPISATFSGGRALLLGQLPAGSDAAFAIMEGPRLGAVRLLRKGRVVLFWMGVRQYELAHAPGLYLVNLHCPTCNGIRPCPHAPDLPALNLGLRSSSERVGPEAILAQTRLEVLGGEPEEGEHARVVDGFWKLQESRGLYGVRRNAIRITRDGTLYHVFDLPPTAPEGKYQIVTHFLEGSTLVAVVRNELFVRQSGLVNWLSRLAERQAPTYGAFTVAIALLSGFLAGNLFKRGARH